MCFFFPQRLLTSWKAGKKQLFIRLTWVQQNLWILANIIVAFERYFEWPIPASIISICSEQDRQGTRSWPATVRRCKKSIGPFLVSDSNLTLWHFDTCVASTASTFALIGIFFTMTFCTLVITHVVLQHAPLSSMGVSYCVSPSSLHIHGTFKCFSHLQGFSMWLRGSQEVWALPRKVLMTSLATWTQWLVAEFSTAHAIVGIVTPQR